MLVRTAITTVKANGPKHSVASIKEALFTILLDILNGKQQQGFFTPLKREGPTKREIKWSHPACKGSQVTASKVNTTPPVPTPTPSTAPQVSNHNIPCTLSPPKKLLPTPVSESANILKHPPSPPVPPPPHQSHRLSQQTWIPASQNWKKSVGSWRTAGRKTLNARICWGQLQSWRRKRWQYLQTIAQRPDSSNVQERQEIPPTHSHTPRPGLKRLPQGMKSKWIAKIGIKGNKSCSTPHVTCLLWRCTHCPWFCPFTLAPKLPWYPQHMMDLKATPLRTGEVF